MSQVHARRVARLNHINLPQEQQMLHRTIEPEFRNDDQKSRQVRGLLAGDGPVRDGFKTATIGSLEA
jgi:hypothetical protein